MARRRLPPLKSLPAFEVAADRLSFSAAAGELYLTHGAISRQMKSLEAWLGTALFRRLNRRLELTGAGAAFLPAVRTALDVLEASAAQVATQPRRGPLVVSCLPTFMLRWLIPRLYDFNARHPAIETRLSASYAPVDFARDGVDAAIRLDGALPPVGVEAHPFLEEQVGPVCSPALLRQKGLRQPADLKRHTLLHTDSRPEAWPHWVKRSGVRGVDPARGPHFDHFYVLLEAAVGGLGVALAPQPLVAEDLKLGRLVAPLGFVPSGRRYQLLVPQALRDAPKIKAFRSWLLTLSSAQTVRVPGRSRWLAVE